MTQLVRIIDLLEQYDRIAANAMDDTIRPFIAPYQLTALKTEKDKLVQELKKEN